MEVSTGPSQHYIFTVRTYPGVDRGTIGFSAPQRKWATLSIGQVRVNFMSICYSSSILFSIFFQNIDVKPFPISSAECLCSIILEADFMSKKT